MSWILSNDEKTLINLDECTSVQLIDSGSHGSRVVAWAGDEGRGRKRIPIYAGSLDQCQKVLDKISSAVKPIKLDRI